MAVFLIFRYVLYELTFFLAVCSGCSQVIGRYCCLQKELKQLNCLPPPPVVLWPSNDTFNENFDTDLVWTINFGANCKTQINWNLFAKFTKVKYIIFSNECTTEATCLSAVPRDYGVSGPLIQNRCVDYRNESVVINKGETIGELCVCPPAMVCNPCDRRNPMEFCRGHMKDLCPEPITCGTVTPRQPSTCTVRIGACRKYKKRLCKSCNPCTTVKPDPCVTRSPMTICMERKDEICPKQIACPAEATTCPTVRPRQRSTCTVTLGACRKYKNRLCESCDPCPTIKLDPCVTESPMTLCMERKDEICPKQKSSTPNPMSFCKKHAKRICKKICAKKTKNQDKCPVRPGPKESSILVDVHRNCTYVNVSDTPEQLLLVRQVGCRNAHAAGITIGSSVSVSLVPSIAFVIILRKYRKLRLKYSAIVAQQPVQMEFSPFMEDVEV